MSGKMPMREQSRENMNRAQASSNCSTDLVRVPRVVLPEKKLNGEQTGDDVKRAQASSNCSSEFVSMARALSKIQNRELTGDNVDRSHETCSICFTDFKMPKQLPCLDTFCLECLSKRCDPADPGVISCHLCKERFTLPQGRVELLPDNELIARLLLQKKLREEMQISNNCEPCMGIGETTGADSFCKECRQSLCRRCRELHTQNTYARYHNIVSTDMKPGNDRLLQQGLMYGNCKTHANQVLEFYCCECKTQICSMCRTATHNWHACVGIVPDVEKDMKVLLAKDKECIEKYLTETKDKVEKFSKENKTYELQTKSIEDDVRKASATIRKLLDEQEAEMLAQITNTKQNQQKKVEIRAELEKIHYIRLGRFLIYSRLLTEMGTNCEIMKSANDLHRRAEQLIRDHNELSTRVLWETHMEFLASAPPSSEVIKKLVGTVLYREIVGHEKSITGLAVLGQEIYVVGYSESRVHVYDSRSLALSRDIIIPGMTTPQGMAACADSRALYISDYQLKCIHRVDLNDDSVTRWKMRENQYPRGVSVTTKRRLLVTIEIRETTDQSGVVEYTSDGLKVREIRFYKNIKYAWQTIQTSMNQFIVSHGAGGSSLHRICAINPEGQIINSYGSEEGRGEDQLSVPLSIAFDKNTKQIFVADYRNNRILLLDNGLRYLGQVQALSDVTCPHRLCFDPATDRLLVGEYKGRLLIVSPSRSPTRSLQSVGVK